MTIRLTAVLNRVIQVVEVMNKDKDKDIFIFIFIRLTAVLNRVIQVVEVMSTLRNRNGTKRAALAPITGMHL